MPWVMSVIAYIVITLLCFCFADIYVDIFVLESCMRVICLLMMNFFYNLYDKLKGYQM
jgi:hypothetical protein